MKLKLLLVGLISFTLLLPSCSDEIIDDNYDKKESTTNVEQTISNVIQQAINNPTNLTPVTCEEPSPDNCFVLDSIDLGDYMDISHCAQGLSDSCYVFGTMIINVCYNFNDGELLVDFDEDVAGHLLKYSM